MVYSRMLAFVIEGLHAFREGHIFWEAKRLGEGGGGGGCVVEMSQLKIRMQIVSCFKRLSMHSYTIKPWLHSSLAPFCLAHLLCLPHLA